MKRQWLEDLVDEGLISEKTASVIYRDCDEIIKSADVKGRAAQSTQQGLKSIDWDRMLDRTLWTTVGAGFGAAGDMIVDSIFNSMEANDMAEKAVVNREQLVKEMPDEDEKIRARFNEMAQLAPAVAVDKNLSKRVLTGKINSGFTSQDAQGLATIQATFTAKNPKIKARAEQTFSQEKVGHITYDVYRMFSEAGMFKEAAAAKAPMFNEYLKALGIATAVPALISAGAGAVRHFYDKHKQSEMRENLEKAFEAAIKDSDPEREPLKQNKDKARQAFQALTHFAPNVAMQPQAARAFMNRMVEYDQGLMTADLKDLTQIESNIRSTQGPSEFAQGFSASARTLGLGQMAQKGVETAFKGSPMSPEQQAKDKFRFQQEYDRLKNEASKPPEGGA